MSRVKLFTYEAEIPKRDDFRKIGDDYYFFIPHLGYTCLNKAIDYGFDSRKTIIAIAADVAFAYFHNKMTDEPDEGMANEYDHWASVWSVIAMEARERAK